MAEGSKLLWTSKTFWFNVAVLIAGAGGVFNIDVAWIDTPAEQTAIAVGAVNVVNVILRMLTSVGVTLK